MRAIREWVAKPPFVGIANFPPARIANRCIGRNLRTRLPGSARADTKASVVEPVGRGPNRDVFDTRKGRRLVPKAADEIVHLGSRTDDPDANASRIVAHVAPQTRLARELPHRGSEANTLHDSPDADLVVRGSGHREEPTPVIDEDEAWLVTPTA